MKVAAKVTTGVCVVVVGGLLALAIPAVSGAYADISSWAVFQSTSEPSAGLSAESASTEDDPVGKKMIDELGDGYVYVGNGTAIPKNNPAGCETPVWLHISVENVSLSGDLIDRGHGTSPRAPSASMTRAGS